MWATRLKVMKWRWPVFCLRSRPMGMVWILAGVEENGSSFARMPTHVMRLHEWGIRLWVRLMCGPPSLNLRVGFHAVHPSNFSREKEMPSQFYEV
jgi:hypothetical protein